MSTNEQSDRRPLIFDPFAADATSLTTPSPLHDQRTRPSSLSLSVEVETPTSTPSRSSYEVNTSYEGAGTTLDERSSRKPYSSPSPLNSPFQQPYELSDTDRLKPRNGFVPIHQSPTVRQFYARRSKWLAWSIILLSLYSTVFSAIFLGIALRQPRWHFISDTGSLTPSDASLLTAILAKSIELSFVTAFVAFLGQVLSRRSLEVKNSGKGVTLAEISMRNWIMQPGAMVTHWETVRYAGPSFLGVVSFLAAIVAMLYTTASDALVQPQLKYGHLERRLISGEVMTSFANAGYIQGQCQTPIALQDDPIYRNTTCLDVSYAARSYHDYQQYIAEWATRAQNTSADIPTDKESRVPGYGLLNSDTFVNGTWIEVAAKEVDGRVINNVSLAMPHVGVQQAARHKRNRLLQPEELGGLGAYTLVGSTASPVIHVLCAGINRSELAPIVYEAWNSSEKLNTSTWPAQVGFYGNDTWLNDTIVDDLFGWGEKYGQHAPVFPKYPIAYNTVMNQTFAYGRLSIYLLGRDGDETQERYAVCQLKASLTPNCSTIYSAATEGSSLTTRCDPGKDAMAYIHSNQSAVSSASTLSPDWPWIGSEWANSLSLNAGITDGKASDARLLTQLILSKPHLNSKLPSLAEALAVMAGSTLLLSTQDTGFSTSWNHTEATLSSPEIQYFNATLRAREYASGPVGDPQKALYLVLLLVFFINFLCLSYFLLHRGGLITDMSEPPNLFSLAVNSSPTASVVGAVGVGGPKKHQYNVQWIVDEVDDRLRVRPVEADELEGDRRSGVAVFSSWKKHVSAGSSARGETHENRESGVELASPAASLYSRFSKRKTFI